MRNLKIVLVFLFMLAVAVAPAWAQTIATANVAGTVTDPSGAVVPGADVTVVDSATNQSRTTQTNKAGHYQFVGLRVGVYTLTVKAKGFRQFEITNANLEVGKDYTFDASLEVGAATQIVEVRATVSAELQTMNSTMGSSLAGETILNLPALNRDVTGLLSYVPTSQPNFSGAESNETAGGIAGQTSDQNTYILDGGVNTDDLAGNNGYPLTVAGIQSGQVTGAMPTPIESIEEFKVNTNNTTADFNTSSGGQILMTTKRGTNSFHGSAYDYLQNSALNSNDFFNNLEAAVVGPKPVSRSNRFGGSVGGPMLPSMLGGKTYFYYNYEGYRYPRAGPIERPVPTNTLRHGILQFPDNASPTPNIVQYNLATSTQCGPTGGEACDPRGLGLNPVVSAMWNQYEPTNYDCSVAGTPVDGLNTCYFIGNISYPLSDNFMVGRIDHDFGSKWRFFTTYRWYHENNANTNQVDIGGLLPGDKLGVPASASRNILQPRYFVAGLTTTISPTLTNDFHFNYLRNFWQWVRAGAYPECESGSGACSGVDAGLEVGGEEATDVGTGLLPMNMDTQDARPRLWDGHDWDYRDTLSWLRGTHFFQFGGEFMHQWLHFDRYDNVVGGLTQPGYEVYDNGVNFTPAVQPIPCTSALTTNCLPASSIGAWNALYSDVAGIVDTTSVVATRSGSNLTLNSLGTPLHSYDLVQNYNLYFSDTWKIKPNLTLSYGLSWSLQMPPYETNREMSMLTDPTGNTSLNVSSYFAQVQAAANNGQAFNPLNTWAPIATVNAGEKYPYPPFYGGFGPRVSIAWSPGGNNRFFGHKTTVIRGGYARVYDRDLPINFIAGTTLGVGFLQSAGCEDPSSPTSHLAACPGSGGTTPATAFRIGTDGNNPPLLSLLTSTLPVPTQPGVNAPYAIVADGIQSNFRPGVSDQIDFSIQRQFGHDTIVELGYLGVWAKHLYQGVDLNDVPWMMKSGGQTFAQAYDNVSKALAAGQTPAAQPFFETSLAASGYCATFANCTAAVAANEAGNIGIAAVTNIWADLDSPSPVTGQPYLSFGNSFYGDTQCYYCYTDGSFGYSNYQALIMSVQKRAGHGLTLNGNATYGHALGTLSLAQTYTFANLSDPWMTRMEYGPQVFDRKFTMNVLGTYQLPFGPGHRYGNSNGVVKRLVGGWAISPIYSYGSGTPNGVYSDACYEYCDQAYGEGYDSAGDAAIPMLNTANLSNKAQRGITSNGVVGWHGDGFTNINLFGSNAAQVFNSFRQPLVGVDFRADAGGNTRGQARWNVDLGFTKDTNITERVHTQLYVQMFNALNHTKFLDPFNSLTDPADFGVIEGQYGVLNYNYTRIIQLGLRVSF
jgi:hypothetical protein